MYMYMFLTKVKKKLLSSYLFYLGFLLTFWYLCLQVKEVCDHMTAELMELKATLTQSQQSEKNSASLVQELTAMVKEQKSRISELVKAKKDAVAELRV